MACNAGCEKIIFDFETEKNREYESKTAKKEVW